MEIYADIVFLINLIMDSLILWVAGKLARRPVAFWRRLLAGAVMAFVYCLFVFVAPFQIYLNLFAAILMPMLGIMVAFSPREPKSFFQLMLYSYLSAFMVGGMGMALFYFTDLSNLIGNITGFTIRHFSIKTLLASCAAFYLLIRVGAHYIERITLKKQALLTVKIYCGGEDVSLYALVDTGNSLHEPITKYPVMIAEFNAIKPCLPDAIQELFLQKRENDLQSLLEYVTESNFSGRIRMIPFESIGRQNGMLIGFRPDKVEITQDKDIYTHRQVVVGIYNCSLSGDGAYQGLLNPELIGNT